MNYYSRGKLLLSGEYLVLKGATALAVPLKKGQELKIIQTGDPGKLSWESKEGGKTWFSASYALPFFDIDTTTDLNTAEYLAEHFQAIMKLNPEFREQCAGRKVVSNLEFKRAWGFGSSSSLVSNLAHWSEVDPFELNRLVSQGSGYDVICARQNGPVFYTLDNDTYSVKEIDLNPSITRHIYFVYLGKKENTANSVKGFLNTYKRSLRNETQLISDLSLHLGQANTIEDFEFYMREHEQIMAALLKRKTLNDETFKNLNGEAKSLGAWGGDFAMLTWNGSEEALKTYLSIKKLNTFFSYNDLVISR